MTIKTKPTKWDRRLEAALQMAGISLGQLASLNKFSKWELTGEVAHGLGPTDVLKLAKSLDVDARWLARGIESDAAQAAVDQLRKLRATKQGRFDRISEIDFERLVSHFQFLPQPELAEANEPTCRYCGCTQFNPCDDGCSWVDRAMTICSACLQVAG